MISSLSPDHSRPLADAADWRAPSVRPIASADAMRQRLWQVARSAVHHPAAWHRTIFDILLLVSFAHIPLFVTIGLARADGFTWPIVGAALALSVTALVMRELPSPRTTGIVMSAVLVVQATLLVLLFRGDPWQAELNFYFVVVIAMTAAFLDVSVLFFTAALVTSIHFVLNGFAPGALFPAGGSIGRGLLHALLCALETICLAFMGVALRLAVEFESKAVGAIARLEDAGRNLAAQLSATSERADRLDTALAAFRHDTSRRLDRLQMASTDLGDTADDFSKAAERTTHQTKLAKGAASDVNRQVREVAATCEDFRAMIAQIGDHALQSTRIAAETVDRAMATATTIDEFTAMSEKIDTILQLIAGIASHTNLLALNATIEAARAGEQGRGFAVVAGEVKTLALQTTAAVADVNQVVTLIKGATSRSVAAIAAVAASIEDLNGVATVIAGAVDERIRAATTMADGIAHAASNLDHMTFAIGDIQAVADETGQGAGFLQDAARAIAHDTAAIRRDVDAFSADVAAA